MVYKVLMVYKVTLMVTSPLFSPFFGTKGVGEGHPPEYLTNYIGAWYNNKCILSPPIFQHLFHTGLK